MRNLFSCSSFVRAWNLWISVTPLSAASLVTCRPRTVARVSEYCRTCSTFLVLTFLPSKILVAFKVRLVTNSGSLLGAYEVDGWLRLLPMSYDAPWRQRRRSPRHNAPIFRLQQRMMQ